MAIFIKNEKFVSNFVFPMKFLMKRLKTAFKKICRKATHGFCTTIMHHKINKINSSK